VLCAEKLRLQFGLLMERRFQLGEAGAANGNKETRRRQIT
jgi:hypothetical protein